MPKSKFKSATTVMIMPIAPEIALSIGVVKLKWLATPRARPVIKIFSMSRPSALTLAGNLHPAFVAVGTNVSNDKKVVT